MSEVLPHIRSGKLRALAVTSPNRWSAMPETPTMVELGYKDISFVEWLGWFAPAASPPPKVAALNAAVNDALASPAMTDVFSRNALEAFRATPDRLSAVVKQEYEYWGKVVKATGFTPED